VNVPGPDGKPIPQIGLPISFSGYAPEYRWAGTRLGSHTDEVLRSLDIRDDEIEGLKKKGIIM